MKGDYVLCNSKICRVKEIGGIVCVATVDDKEEFFCNEFFCNAEDIEPIPLTAEILKKNGFEKTELPMGSSIYTFSDKDEFYAIAIDEYTDSVWRVEYSN